ncbi:uncharacterized protein METZ01_LOCUS214628, partial [marine metagenome]
MKQYIMGMITGASLIACVFMFMGATDGGSGRYSHYRDSDNSFNIINTATGEIWKRGIVRAKN